MQDGYDSSMRTGWVKHEFLTVIPQTLTSRVYGNKLWEIAFPLWVGNFEESSNFVYTGRSNSRSSKDISNSAPRASSEEMRGPTVGRQISVRIFIHSP